ncbi:hypothetical protein QQ045_024858 [Rhodiola kirilowii]
MPTRYTLDVDLKDVVTPDALQSRDKKVTAAKEAKARFEERFKTGKNRWFFSKLSFEIFFGAFSIKVLTEITPEKEIRAILASAAAAERFYFEIFLQ